MPELSANRFRLIAFSMVVVAVVVYINNVIVLPSLRAPDGFGHFTYIWYLAETGRLPWATEGWSFFHPPLYYAFMATIWQMFPSADPVVRLKLGTGLIALLSIAQAGVAYLVVRKVLPTNRVAQLLAIGLMLFLPVRLFTVGYLGNERLNAVFCGFSLIALIWLLNRPVWSRAALLGVLLGLALLVKFTALAVVAGAFATILLSFYFRGDLKSGLRVLIIVGVTMSSVCGWFYVRNVIRYGTPIQMSRDTEMVKRVENIQIRGQRNLLEFVLFDPLIFATPQWPRGMSVFEEARDSDVRSALRESVWTGIFANAWFDGVGGQVIPNTRSDPTTRHSGQLLLALAIAPTLLILVGVGSAVWRLRRDGWNDVYGAMLISFTAMLTIFIYGMTVVPMHGAVKATYLMPVSVTFAFWLAVGFDTIRGSHAGVARALVAVCAAVGVVSVVVFSLGVVIGRGYLRDGLEDPVWQNLYGVVEYAGGNKSRALELFRSSASAYWHLGSENVAAMALEADRPLLALQQLRAAGRMQPIQAFGLPADRRDFVLNEAAEYSLLIGVANHRLGRLTNALISATQAVKLDRAIPEANYNLGVLRLIASRSDAITPEGSRELLDGAREQFQKAWDLDPTFREAIEMVGVTDALLGDCERAWASFGESDELPIDVNRPYPYETGPGDMHTAGIGRRLVIDELPEQLEPAYQKRACARVAE